MAAFSGRRQFGLFTNGQAQDGTDNNFTAYNYTNADALSGDGCFMVDYNVYGSATQGDEFIPVDPANEYYTFSVSVKTYQRSYNNRLGSGHLGFACYDENKYFISHNQAYSDRLTTLTRPANPGDTKIYVGRGDWYDGATSHARSVGFYFPSGPYSTPGGYSRHQMYAKIVQNSIVQTAQGDWEVSFTSGLPDWGYQFAVGTPCGNNQAGGSYNYALGSPTYPETWTTYTTGVMHGYVIGSPSSGANFRDGTKYIKFLNLRNYNYRTESAGNSARYYIDNIMLYRVKPPTPVQVSQGKSYHADFENSTIREKISKVSRFKRARRGGQKREDFL